ncbi:cation-transporting P-type ATPase [Streptomyces sp. NPDC001273]
MAHSERAGPDALAPTRLWCLRCARRPSSGPWRTRVRNSVGSVSEQWGARRFGAGIGAPRTTPPASSATGLSSAEAARRLTRHGPNAIPKEPRAPRVAAGAATAARSADPGAVGGRRLDDRHR